MYLREVKRRNADGTAVGYLQLAHNERDPITRVPQAKLIHQFGRTDQVDRDALARLVRSISRFLDPAQVIEATATGAITVLDSRPLGASFVADRLWDRLGIGAAIRQVATGRRVDGDAVERAVFAMVANRLSVKPLSKLAGCTWVAERVVIDGLPAISDDACYRAMDFFHAALAELQETVFWSTARLLDLDLDLLFFDTTSTYWETDRLDPDVLPDDGTDAAAPTAGPPDEEAERPTATAGARRAYSKHSKDHRPDLPQIVIGLAVTREGIPVRVWTFAGTESDQVLIRTVRNDLRGWRLNRVIWVLDRGFTSAANRRYLQKGGGHYIVGEKLRSDQREAQWALQRAGRYHEVAGNLRVKEVRQADGVARDRFVICHNPEQATRDAAVRDRILQHLEVAIAETDRLAAGERRERYGALRTTPAFARLLRRTPGGKLRIDRAAVARETQLDGKFLLRTDDESLSAADIAQGYKALYEAERGWRDLKSTLDLRPVYHWKPSRIEAHVQLCWLALLLLRVAEVATHDTWRDLRNELDRCHLVTFRTSAGVVAQRSELTPGQLKILRALELPEPPRFYEFAPAAATPTARPAGGQGRRHTGLRRRRVRTPN